MKKIPEPVEENSIDTELLEENDNFLPESYVLNAEKRKIILTIMQEELTAIQYQTILLYYFDGMSVPEIAACMECPEGTVKYRLSAARGKIKQGVQDYENTSGIKLYSSGSVALLTAIFCCRITVTCDSERACQYICRGQRDLRVQRQV